MAVPTARGTLRHVKFCKLPTRSHKHFLLPVKSSRSLLLCRQPPLKRSSEGAKIRKMLSYETTSGCKKHWKLLWKIIIRIHIANNIMTYSQFSYRNANPSDEENPKHESRRWWRRKERQECLGFLVFAVPEIWGFIKHVFCSALQIGAVMLRADTPGPGNNEANMVEN